MDVKAKQQKKLQAELVESFSRLCFSKRRPEGPTYFKDCRHEIEFLKKAFFVTKPLKSSKFTKLKLVVL